MGIAFFILTQGLLQYSKLKPCATLFLDIDGRFLTALGFLSRLCYLRLVEKHRFSHYMADFGTVLFRIIELSNVHSLLSGCNGAHGYVRVNSLG